MAAVSTQPVAQEPPMLMRVDEAARVSGIPRSTLYRLIHRGALGDAVVRLGSGERGIRLRRKVFLERVEAGQIEPAA